MREATADERPPVAAAVIVSDGKVLLARRRVREGPLSWQFPAGEVEAGEPPGRRAVLEAEEETGLTVRVTHNLGRRVHPSTGRTMYYFACEVVSGTARVADPEELAEVAWCDRAALVELIPYPLYERVRQFLDANLG
jgi:8-oxo-dGTP diphosphatase